MYCQIDVRNRMLDFYNSHNDYVATANTKGLIEFYDIVLLPDTIIWIAETTKLWLSDNLTSDRMVKV